MTGAGIGLNVGVSNCYANWKRQIRILFLEAFSRGLLLEEIISPTVVPCLLVC